VEWLDCPDLEDGGVSPPSSVDTPFFPIADVFPFFIAFDDIAVIAPTDED